MADLPVVMAALGEGWLGKLIVAALAGGGAWFLRRPVEKAAILDMVNKRMTSLMEHQESLITYLTAQHSKCEERCDKLEAEVAQLRGEVRQEKQTIESITRIKP